MLLPPLNLVLKTSSYFKQKQTILKLSKIRRKCQMPGPPIQLSTLEIPKVIKSFKTVLLGAPGSFKTQLANKIATTFKIEVVPVRQRINENIAKDSKFGELCKTCLEQNILIPDKIMINFISKEILECEVKQPVWLISGFPVTESQAKLFWEKVKLHKAFFVQLPEDVSMKNLLERYQKKSDVGEETSKTLEQMQKIVYNYNKISEPTLKFYKELNILKSIYSNNFDAMWEKLHKEITILVEELELKEKK